MCALRDPPVGGTRGDAQPPASSRKRFSQMRPSGRPGERGSAKLKFLIVEGAKLKFLIVEVEGDPAPEPRPRFVLKTGLVYVPENAHRWKHAIRVAVRVALVAEGLRVVPEPGVAFAMGFLFRFQRPQSHYRTGRFSHLVSGRAPRFHTQKPDLDNLIKAATDALGEFDGKASIVWADDSQVDRYIGTPRKRWCEEGEVPGLTLVLSRVDCPE